MESIFKGPSFYEEKDKRYFLGRDKEAEDLLYLVENSDFSVCYAESGEGKSSLINAGLQPRMREKGLFPIRITFNENDFTRTPANIDVDEKNPDIINFDQLIWDKIWETICFARNTDLFGDLYKTLTIQSSTITDDKVECRETVWWKLRYNELRINSYENITPVLIFDQFEEVFTRSKDIGWTDSFFKWLEELYRDDRYENVFVEGGRTKKFKVLLSLRSDYVCELDYWCMNKHFIPSLKNNRYCLKPLSKHSAYMIVKQLVDLPKGINYDDIIKSAKIERSGDWKDIDNTLPCISALVLSLVLTGLDEGDDDITSKLNELIQENKENISDDFFFFVMNHIYEKALEKSGIGKKSTLRDILEESLVDTNGRRRVVSRLDKNLQSIPERIISKLAKERIIIVSGMNVEISHDCLRKVIEKHNAERQRELEKEKRRNYVLMRAAKRARLRAIRQKDNIYVALILFISFFVSYLFLRFHSYPKVVPYFATGGEFLPILKELGFVASIAFVPTMLCGFFYYKKWGRMYIVNITSLAVFFLFLYSVFVLYDSIFCPVERYVSGNEDSAKVLLFVPCLFFSVYQRKPIWHYIAYTLLLTPFVINAFGIFSLPLWGLVLNLATASVFVIFSFFTRKTRIYNFQERLKMRLFWILSNIVVLSISVYFQLGFHLTAVDYDIAQRDNRLSRPWKTIVIRYNEKSGLLDAKTGKEIVPCVFDSIFFTYDSISKDYTYSYFYISDSIDVETGKFGGFNISHERGTDSLKVSWLFSPDYERVIHSYSEKKERTLKSVSAIVYKELRKEIINCLQANIQPNIDNIYSLYQLDSLHKVQTYQALVDINKKTDSYSITDYDINKLYRAIYSDLCLCAIKDRLINHDLTGIMNLFSLYQTCEFQEEQFENFKSTYTYSEEGTTLIGFSTKDLEENNSFAYSGMLHMISGLDINPHAIKILDKLKEDNTHLASLRDSVLKEIKVINVIDFYKSVFVKVSNGQSFNDAKKNTLAQLKGGVDKQISRFSALDQMFVYNYIESEGSYKQLADAVLTTLTPIIKDGKCVNYNSSLIDICRELTKVSVCRWYEDGDKYVKELRDADDRRLKESYKLTEEIVMVVNDSKGSLELAKQQIREVAKGLTQKVEQLLIDK